MKRQIKSEAELVSALSKLVILEKQDFNGVWIKNGNNNSIIEKLTLFCNDVEFRYSDPVEVVELWGFKCFEEFWFDRKCVDHDTYTHKQTQIIQNGSIIWTETEEI